MNYTLDDFLNFEGIFLELKSDYLTEMEDKLHLLEEKYSINVHRYKHIDAVYISYEQLDEKEKEELKEDIEEIIKKYECRYDFPHLFKALLEEEIREDNNEVGDEDYFL